ncbi:MAG: T9SS type A sorting domain-containing protein [Chlorobi bacterium]|nr:T9SS type A sorting domain-containing protein [Chlorobiota bacterium]
MNKILKISLFTFPLIIAIPKPNYAQSQMDCSPCHSAENNHWMMSHHADTQNDVANELAEEWAGLPPDSVISGQDAENCVACHSATSITANSGMTEVQTMGYFFSTTDGLYTDSTHALHTDVWQHNACVTCHDVPANHPESMPTLAIFNSSTAQYDSVANASTLCGQCHGTLRFPDTDHRRLDAWQMSKHSHGGQNDVAGELGEEWAGSTSEEVIGEENCIACHAPTAVMNNTLTEAQALGKFFTTASGVFISSTAPQDTSNYPQVACIACHDPHESGVTSYFNSSTKKYEVMPSQKLCGQCHGNLRFPDTDHLSYNIEEGAGGKGVAGQVTMPGIKCVDCHMHTGDVDGTNAVMFGGHSWEIFINETDGGVSASCTVCHSTMTASAAMDTVNSWKAEFVRLDSIAHVKINEADTTLINSTDTSKIRLLADAKFNLAYAESDESGGVHNHLYTQALMKDAINKANQIITGISYNSIPIAKEFKLYQNYPNPFSSSTNIEYTLPKAANVKIEVFDITGQKIKILLINKYEKEGLHSVRFNAANLPKGIYFCKMISGQFEMTIKMIHSTNIF